MEILLITISYVLGSIPCGLLLAKHYCHIDPRTAGSFNVGSTNVARLCGKKWGALTLLCDIFKGFIPVLLARLLSDDIYFMMAVAAATIVGHVFSCFLRFQGGKAVATTIGAFLALSPVSLLCAVLLCLICIKLSGYVSLGSLVLVIALPIFMAISEQYMVLPLALATMLLVIWKHRTNVQRLLSGTEKSWKKTAYAEDNMQNFPTYRGDLEYVCLNCNARYASDELLYTCPKCNGVFLLEDKNFEELKKQNGEHWRKLFDARTSTKHTALRGIFRYYELMAPVMDAEDIVYLGEGHTPIVDAAPALKKLLGMDFAYKNDGQNPSASFKDRGMACAFSYLQALVRKHNWEEVLTVCASTGDTSAAAAQYAAYVGGPIKSVVLLPHGKVTPQQLAQPLGSGALVLEMPGVFDDCMKVVESLAETCRVALLNSKNSWRILGQESYAFEVAQWYNWDVSNLNIFVPIGNAGNITAIMSGFLKLYELNIIESLPRIFGVQSHHADPVYRYYAADAQSRVWEPVKVQASVAQAAMIGNPVSFPRVQNLVDKYIKKAGEDAFHVLQVTEQQIMDAMLLANKHGHIACTQGGECFAGMRRAMELKLINANQKAVLDATAHSIKFSGFQDMYFSNSFPSDYGIVPQKELMNNPELLLDAEDKKGLNSKEYTTKVADIIIKKLALQRK